MNVQRQQYRFKYFKIHSYLKVLPERFNKVTSKRKRITDVIQRIDTVSPELNKA